MTLLWAILAVMAMAGAMLVLMPLLKYQPRKDVSSDVLNSLVYRDRLQELESDLQQGRVTEQEFTQLKAELELTLLEDVSTNQDDKAVRSAGGKFIVWPLLVLIPLMALGLYWKEGYTPEVKGWIAAQPAMAELVDLMMAGDFAALEQRQAQLPDVIRGLQVHVQDHPHDGQTWYLLGASYMQLRMPQQAELAFSRALHVDDKNVDYLLGFAQASVMLNDGKITPELHQSLRAIIQQQPSNPKPYMTLGMVAFQNGDFANAIAVWEQYLQREDADERAADLLQRSVAVARKQIEDAQTTAVAQNDAAADKPVVQVTVSVSDDVRSQLAASDVLFIYAKAVNGPPMPLAVVRQPVGQWPVQAQLSDANAMTPMATLSKFDEVIVQARISPTGNAVPQSGDWVGPTQVIKLQPGQQSVALEITSRMP